MNELLKNTCSKTLVVVESPFQLLSAFEAIGYFEVNEYDLFIRINGDERCKQQIINVVELLGFKSSSITFVFIGIKKRKLSDYFRFIYYCCFFRLISKRYNKVFIGNYRSKFLNALSQQFSRKKIIILDDGNVTIDVHNKFTLTNNRNIFTMYDLDPFLNQKIFKNEYRILRSIVREKGTRNDLVCFIGPGVVSAGIIPLENYSEFLSIIVKKYKDLGLTVMYIPHRNESIEEISTISELVDLSVFSMKLPIEFLGLYEIEMPFKFCSFYSTALLTMQKIYGAEVESYVFNYENSKYKDEIDSVYDYYRSIIDVIDLPELR